MTTYDLRKKTDASTGQKITPLGSGVDPSFINRVIKLDENNGKIHKRTPPIFHEKNIYIFSC